MWPSISDRHFFTVSSTEGLYKYQFAVDLSNQYILRPLDIRTFRGTLVTSVIDYSFAHFLSAGFGITDWLQVGVTFPVFSRAQFTVPTISPTTAARSVFHRGALN